MSERNGDKAKFGRERKRKIFRRKRLRELRKALEGKTPEPTTAASEQDGLDEQEAPQREIEHQKQRHVEDRAEQEKARLANKPNFRP